jgi:hypothetical protein
MTADLSHVSESLDVGPVLCKDFVTIFVDFDLPFDFKAACPFET